MFKRVTGADCDPIEIFLNGVPAEVPADINVAAAILLQYPYCRETAVTGMQRGPFCMMGACFDCIVEIDGNENQQACLRQVQAGMQINFQTGPVQLPSEKTI